MNEDDAARTKGFVDKAAGLRHADEEILVRVVLNRDTKVPYARVRVFGRDGFGADRNDVCDAALCQRAGRLCGDETKGGRELSRETKEQKGKYRLSQKESSINDDANVLESHFG